MRTGIVICLLLLTPYTRAAVSEGDCLVNYLGAALDSPAGKELIAAYRVESAMPDPNVKLNGRGLQLDFNGGSLRSISFALVGNAHLPMIGVWSGPLPFGLRPTDPAQLLKRRFGKPREDYTSSVLKVYTATWESPRRDARYDQALAAIGCIAPETGRGDAPFSIKQYGLQPARVWCGQSVPAGYWVQYGRNLYVYGSAKGSNAPSCRKIPDAPRPTISPNYQHCSHGVLCNGRCCEYPSFCHRNGPGIGVGESCL